MSTAWGASWGDAWGHSWDILSVAPVADFIGTPTSGAAPLTVSFTDLSSHSPTSWLWDFGDGNTSTLQNPSHAYSDPGSYTVSLTATNAFGDDTKTVPAYIAATAAPEPSDGGGGGGGGSFPSEYWAAERRTMARRKSSRKKGVDIAVALMLLRS